MKFGSKIFGDILDLCINKIFYHGMSIDECLSQYPDQNEQLAPLIKTALLLRKGGSIKPSQEYHESAFIRMQNLISANPRNKFKKAIHSNSTRSPSIITNNLRYVFLTIIIALIFITLSLTGVSYASTSAMPGDFLYSVKIELENIELKLVHSELEKALFRLEIASRRLEEAKYLVSQGKNLAINSTISEYNYQVTAVVSLLENESKLNEEDRSILLSLTNLWFLNKMGDLTVLLELVNENNQNEIKNSLNLSRTSQERVIKLLERYPKYIEQLPGLVERFATKFPEALETILPFITTTPTLRFEGSPTMTWYYSETELYTPIPRATSTPKVDEVKTKIATLYPSLTLPPEIPTSLPKLRTPIPRDGKPTRIPQTAWPTLWPNKP